MLFFPTILLIKRVGLKSYHVFLVGITATLIYCFYPYFVPRILSYFTIWWVGVKLADDYLRGRELSFANCTWSIGALMIICGMYLGASILSISSGVSLSLGIHPFIELRHFSFALFVVCMSIVWSKYQWRFFEGIFRPFLVLAPMSYAIYISHYHLVTNASYLSIVNNKVVEIAIYIIVMLVVSWVIELRIYPLVLKMVRRQVV